MPHDNQKGEKKELVYITEDGELNVPIMFEAVMVKLMGKALDYGRMSIQNDLDARKQFERSVKDATYDLVKFAKTILEKYGIEEPK